MNQPLGRTYMALAAMYRPARLNVPLIFFSSHWSGRSWRRISSHAEVVELGGGHFDWITAHAEITGRLLQARLKGATELVPNLAYGADEASNPVFNIALAYQKTAALIAAVKLDIFTLIGSGTRTVGELSVDTGASTRGLRILCDYLTSLELLTKADVQYALAPAAARYLDRSSPSAVGSAIDFASAPEMLRLVLDDPVSYVRRGGSEGLANIAPDNPIWVRFARGMAPFAAVTAKRLAAYVVSQPDRPGTILDIAAGHGLYGIEMAKALPDAIVTAIDWSKVLVVAVENARAAGVDERLRTIAGSAFDVPWGVDFDLVLLPNFLHHFNREKNVSLLRKARESRSPGGRVYVVDFVPDADRVHPAFAANFAFWMLASTPGGDAYTFDDIRDMGEDAGFGHVTARPLPPTPQTLVVLEG
jgi:SAM-dependent methyltransferase